MSQTTSKNTSSSTTVGGAIASIVRADHHSSYHHQNGGVVASSGDKTLITSLNYNLSHVANNGSTNGSANNNHTYQNISQFKQIQNLLQTTFSAANGSNGHHHNNHNHHHQPSNHHYQQNGVATAKVAAPSVPPPPPQSAPQSNKISVNQANASINTPQPTIAPLPVNSSSSSATNGTSNTTLTPVLAKTKTLDGYVGFANLPNQVYRKAVKKGFEFNLMVIGESGLGKSTFVNSLFLAELYSPGEFPGTFERSRKKTTAIDSTSVSLNEKGVNLRLTVIDTPGFGECIDNSNCWQPIVDYVDSRYEDFLIAESKINRELPIPDRRVHCCLHFIAPGHTVNQLDIEVMKKLHDRVNLIPVIAKADTMTVEELKQFKASVLNVINENKLQIYEFPDLDDDDVETNRNNSILKSKLPFAIVGSNTIVESEGKTFRGRQYPWGCVNIDDLAHCDFMALRTMLIRTHMQDLKDVTNNVHYENYRFKKLAYVTGDKIRPTNKNPFQQLEDERKEAESRLEKMKAEMESVFDNKVKEKIARLKESEANLEKQQEQMKQSLEKEERELEEKRLIFLKEKQLWEDSNRDEEDRMRLSLEKEADKKKKKIF